MTRRLVVSYVALAVLILVILEVPLAVLGQRFEHDLATTQASQEVSGLAVVVGDDLDDHRVQSLQTEVAAYESRTNGEVAVVDPALAPIAGSSADADDDVTGEWRSLVDRAVRGATVSMFTSDEGRPVAVVATPVDSDGHVIAVVVLSTPATFTEQRIHEIWLALTVFAAAALLAATGAGWLLARSVGQPLSRLQSTVHRFGRGDFSSRVAEERGPPGIRGLADDFNEMADRITDLMAAQDRFVADASHQLRSPLTALRLRIENLEAEAKGLDAGALAAVASEVQRLSRIVDGLLALGRAGHEQPGRALVDVGQVVAERADAWCALAAERQVELSAVGAVPDLVAELVPGDLDQILDNLLANAVEATPVGGHIQVRVQRDPTGQLTIRVVDDGPGLDAGARERAFDRFWQGPAAAPGSSGLGLAIVRQMARRNATSVELHDHLPHGLEAVVKLRSAQVKERQNLAQ